MKKALVLFLVLCSVVSFAVAKPRTTQLQNAKGHLLWDETDGVFRCVGSATNCDF